MPFSAVLAVWQKGLADRQRGAAEKESTQRQQLLGEAARSDQIVAEQEHTTKPDAALARLARSLRYDPSSSFGAEAAMPLILNAPWEVPRVTYTGHAAVVNTAVFSPDGVLVATSSGDGTARIYDARSGTCLHTLAGHTQPVFRATFDSKGTRLLTWSSDQTATSSPSPAPATASTPLSARS